MSLTTKRQAFILSWTLLVFLSFYTVLSDVSNPFELEGVLLLNLFQRLSGLLAFVFIATQIILGRNLDFWVKHLGGWVYKFHKSQGVFGYPLLLVHPLTQFLIDSNFLGTGGALLNFLPKADNLLFGKLAFYLFTLIILTAYLRQKYIFRRVWKKIHLLSFFAFYLMALHSWALGTDTKKIPFVFVYWLGLVLVTFSLFKKRFTNGKK